MTEKKVITLSELKTVMEEVATNYKKIIEVVQHNHSETQAEFQIIKGDIRSLKEQAGVLTVDVHGLKGQVALLHEGQTEIKNSLKQKVGRDEFAALEMRVARLENKAA